MWPAHREPDCWSDDGGAHDYIRQVGREDAQDAVPHKLDDVDPRAALRDEVARDDEESDDGEVADRRLPVGPPKGGITAPASKVEGVGEDHEGSERESDNAERIVGSPQPILKREAPDGGAGVWHRSSPAGRGTGRGRAPR